VDVTATHEEKAGSRGVLRTLAVFSSLTGVTAALTLVFLSMRSVMKIGGFCAQGGPYVIQHPCPHGVTGILPASIIGGLILAGVYAFATSNWDIPNFTLLLWSALFLSLGWNFFQYAFNPPAPMKGVAVGWLVCGIVFVLMGGLPLIVVGPMVAKSFASPEKDDTSAFSNIPIVYANAHKAEAEAAAAAEPKEAEKGMSAGARVYWLCVQLAAVGVGIWAGVLLFDWAT
jgi:hypothetical protein